MKRLSSIVVLLLVLCGSAHSQVRRGDLVGSVYGGAVKYHGEFSDDMFGPIGGVSLRYAILAPLWIEGRFGLGEYTWKITDAKIARYPEYFGANASPGDKYPGTLTTIESENESRITTADLLLHYVVVRGIRASPYISAGIGLVNIAPSNSSEHSALPNNLAGVYSRSIFSFILGGGVEIPLSQRVGIQFRGEQRFVLSGYLDDVSFNGSNDGVSTFTIGLTYRFNTPRRQRINCDRPCNSKHHCEAHCEVPCRDECVMPCSLCGHYCHCCHSCHCCCCCCEKVSELSTPAVDKGSGGGGGGGGLAKADVPPGPPGAGSGPTPEPMDVPCPPKQHRECFGPPGYGICVDDDPPLGPEPIRWDLARGLEDGSELREVDGRWYRRQTMPDGTKRITKGLLPFESSECKECKEKLEKMK